MKQSLRVSKRILAAFLSLTVSLSVLSAFFSLFAFAVSSDDYVIENNYDNISSKTSVVSGNPVVDFIKEDLNFKKSITAPVLEKLSDNDFSTEFFASEANGFFDLAIGAGATDKTYSSIGQWHISGDRYLQVTLPIKSGATIENILVIHHPTSYLRMGSFELFASSGLTDLFSAQNSVAKIDNSSAKKAHNISFKTGKELTNVFFVGMRIYNPVADTSEAALSDFVRNANISAIYPRFLEFNVYGEAPTTEFNLSEGTSAAIPAGIGMPIVKSVEMEFFRNGTSVFTSSAIGDLYDNDASTTVGMLYNDGKCSYLDSEGKPYGSAYAQLTYTMQDAALIKDFVAVHHNDPKLRTGAYTLYFGNNKATLYTNPAKLYKFTNIGNSVFQRISVTDEPLTYKYAGIRIFSPVKDLQNYLSETGHTYTYCVPRIYEMNFYGEVSAPKPGDVDAGKTIPDGNNILLGRTDAVVASYDTNAGSSKFYDRTSTKLTDGDTSVNWDLGEGYSFFVQKNAGSGLYEVVLNDSTYTDIAFSLGGTATVDKIYVAHHLTQALRTKKYAVYMSTDETDIFNASNLIETVENNGNFANVIEFSEALQGIRGIGIRIYDPCYDYSSSVCSLDQAKLAENPNKHNIYPRISEIAVIGTFQKDPVVFKKIVNSGVQALPDDVDLSASNNLSAYWNPYAKFTKEDTGETINVASNLIPTLSDGNLTNEVQLSAHFAEWDSAAGKGVYHIEDGKRYLDIIYDLKTLSNIDYIVVSNHNQAPFVTGKYDVFLGDNDKTLFENEPYVTVDNVADFRAGKSNKVNVICFEEGKDDEAKYVAIRIYNPVCDATDSTVVLDANNNFVYPRLFEFAVYGSFCDPNFDPADIKKLISPSEVNLSEFMLENGDSLIANQNVTCYVDGAKQSNGVWSTRLKDIINNGDGTKHNDITGGMKNYIEGKSVVDFYWKLKTDSDAARVDGFIFKGISSNSPMYFTSRYQIYVAQDPEDLWKEESLAFDFDAEKEGNMQGVVYNFGKKAPIGNYIGLRIINPVYSATEQSYPRISLFYVFGEDSEIPGVPANLAENMPIIPNFIQNGKKVEVTESNLTAKETANLTDSNNETKATIDTKGKKRDTFEITYNLCNDVEIDDIWVSALLNSDIGFSKMKVYAADTISGVNHEKNLIWTYKTGSKKGEIKPKKTFKKPLEARYLRFVFEGTRDSVVLNEIYVNGLDNQKMKTRNITGTLSSSSIDLIKTKLSDGSETFLNIESDEVSRLIDNDIFSYMTIYDESKLGEVKYDIVVNLEDLRTISNIKMNFLKQFEEYWPTKLNIYIGETYDDACGKGVKPSYTIKTKNIKNAEWNKDLRPILARYIRIELLDFAKNDIYVMEDGKQLIVATIADFKVTGTKVVGLQTSEESTTLFKVHSEDEKFAVSVNRLDVNDIYSDIVSVKFIPEKATNWQMKTLNKTPYLKVVDKTVYRMELYDLFGKPVKNIGGRELVVHIKIPAGEEMLYMIGDAGERAKMSVLDTFFSDGECLASFKYKPDADNKIALLKMTTYDDEYWSTIGELEDFEEASEDDLYEEVEGSVIITEDRRFIVKSLYEEFQDGVKFSARDISLEASDADYNNALYFYPGKKVAVFYDVNFELSNMTYEANTDYEITYAVPDFVSNNFRELQVVCVNEGAVYEPYSYESEGKLYFTIGSAGKYAIIGTPTDGYVGVSPETGESPSEIFGIFSLMFSALYVALKFSKNNSIEANKEN